MNTEIEILIKKHLVDTLKLTTAENKSQKQLQDEIYKQFSLINVEDIVSELSSEYKDQMSTQEAQAKLAALISNAHALVKEAEKMSQAYQLPFSWSGGGYGMGGYFGEDDGWNSSSCDEDGVSEYVWMASSQSC